MTRTSRFLALALLLLAPCALRADAPLDFDGDGISDRTVFRNGTWWIDRSASGTQLVVFGLAGDTLVPADYDGDGNTDVAIWRNGVFWIRYSGGGAATLAWGTAGDEPRVVADYDGDGNADLAIYRPSTSSYWIRRSSDSAVVVQPWGLSGDVPIPGNFTGSSRADFCVYRPSTNTFHVLDGQTSAYTPITFGDFSTDRIVAMNRVGSSYIDFCVFRNSGPQAGSWYSLSPQGTYLFEPSFGVSGDLPLPFVQTAFGNSSLALVRTVGGNLTWYRRQNPEGFYSTGNWGLAGDVVPGYTFFTR